MNLRQRLDEIRTLAEKATPGILVLTNHERATLAALLEVVEAQHRALEAIVEMNPPLPMGMIEAARAALSLMDKEES